MNELRCYLNKSDPDDEMTKKDNKMWFEDKPKQKKSKVFLKG